MANILTVTAVLGNCRETKKIQDVSMANNVLEIT
jgi:hypothetical protein